eukprot:TRINITY_DN1125_c0_g1_i1.p1 TRINITY_DN1125_c0_g1~~TRINITY_DN1125_c0_g1_i1.p1  ORF type:complete len:125 (-),score=34.18 TRINITY_DN1125_c0_g1_i1:78-452(-)
MSDDIKARYGGGSSAHEAYLESKRDAIRRAMKNAFLKKAFNPAKNPGAPFLDSAMLRFASAHYTRTEFFYPTLRNVSIFSSIVVIPNIVLGYIFLKEKRETNEAIQRGDLPYHSLERYYRRYYY